MSKFVKIPIYRNGTRYSGLQEQVVNSDHIYKVYEGTLDGQPITMIEWKDQTLRPACTYIPVQEMLELLGD